MAVPPVETVCQRYCPFVPPEALMLMEVFWQPEFGTTVGAAGQTIKLVVLVAVLLNTVTAIGPVLAPTGTVVVMVVVVLAVTVAVVPLNVTVLFAATTSKFVPVMVTVVPIIPDVGVKEDIVGGGGGTTILKLTVSGMLQKLFCPATRTLSVCVPRASGLLFIL